MKNNQDLSKAGMKTLKGTVKHYITIGYFERKLCSPKEDRGKDSIGLSTKTTAAASATSITHVASASLSEKPSKANAKDMT